MEQEITIKVTQRFSISKTNLFWEKHFSAIVILRIFFFFRFFQIFLLDNIHFFCGPHHRPMEAIIDSTSQWWRGEFHCSKSQSIQSWRLPRFLPLSPSLLPSVLPHAPHSYCCWKPQLLRLMSSLLHWLQNFANSYQWKNKTNKQTKKNEQGDIKTSKLDIFSTQKSW